MSKKYLQTKTGKEHAEFVRSHQESLKDPRPTEGKRSLTEIHGQEGELVIMPESALEITRRVNLFPKIIEALEDLWESLPDKIRESSIPETLYERIEALLKEAKGETPSRRGR